MAEVPATQAWVDQLVTARMAAVQNAMSIDIRAEFEETKTRLRAEFEETKTRMTASIDGLQSATDARSRPSLRKRTPSSSLSKRKSANSWMISRGSGTSSRMAP